MYLHFPYIENHAHIFSFGNLHSAVSYEGKLQSHAEVSVEKVDILITVGESDQLLFEIV